MQQNATKFEWTSKRLKAAQLVSEDKLTNEEIAKNLSINPCTLARWKNHAEFKARLEQIVQETHEKLIARGVVEKQNRLNALDDRCKRMAEVIRQRSEAYKEVDVGGNTGLVVKQVKGIGKGTGFQVVEEYAVDTGLLRELREHEKQAAIELGEWAEKHEHTGKDGADLFQHITVEIVDGKDDTDQ